jgi:hypothetical protein
VTVGDLFPDRCTFGSVYQLPLSQCELRSPTAAFVSATVSQCRCLCDEPHCKFFLLDAECECVSAECCGALLRGGGMIGLNQGI